LNGTEFAMDTRAVLDRAALVLVLIFGWVSSACAQTAWQTDWERIQAAARKEGKVVVAIPLNPDLRKVLDGVLRSRFGIEPEFLVGQSSVYARRVADEYQAGVRYFDVIIAGIENLLDRLLPMGAVEALEPYWILPEVKDPKNWWGGHLYADKSKRFVYIPYAYTSSSVWYNGDLVKPEELGTFDDLLHPKWKGRIGLLDPRGGGVGLGLWSFLWMTKGEEFLKRLLQQNPFIQLERRVLGESLARGKIAITVGPSYYTFVSFIKAGIPIKPFPRFKEGTFVTFGSGPPVVIKNAPHPNATKVFVNWLLSKEGQATWGKAHGQPSRRVDVETSSLIEIGEQAAKDFLSFEEFNTWENQSEDKILSVRHPAREFARKLLP
jgi:iron(III) transport system substrate-binding protein